MNIFYRSYCYHCNNSLPFWSRAKRITETKKNERQIRKIFDIADRETILLNDVQLNADDAMKNVASVPKKSIIVPTYVWYRKCRKKTRQEKKLERKRGDSERIYTTDEKNNLFFSTYNRLATSTHSHECRIRR